MKSEKTTASATNETAEWKYKSYNFGSLKNPASLMVQSINQFFNYSSQSCNRKAKK